MTTGPATPLGIAVLDTNVISELMSLAPDMRVQDWVREVLPSAFHTTSVTLAEVRFGIARLPEGRRRTLLAAQYGDIVVEREQAGAPISGFDAQIAAICRWRRATLATRNSDDFSRLGLDVIDSWLIDT